MKISSSEIASRLEEIIDYLNNKNHLINPYFRISKGTKEQLKPYSILQNKCPRVRIILYLLIKLPTNCLLLLQTFFFSILLKNQYKHFTDINSENKTIFLSHGIGQNLIIRNSDQFFARMPQYLYQAKRKVSILYTNHYNLTYRKNLRLLNLKNDSIQRYLIPKFLKPNEHLRYFLTITPLSFDCFKAGIREFFNDPTKSVVLLMAFVNYFSRSTYSTYLVSLRVENFCKNNETELLFMTLEGHNYEQYVLNQLKLRNLNVKVNFYQHSPITKEHFGLFQFVKSNFYEVNIFNTGVRYRNLLRSVSDVPKYIVIGSIKSKRFTVKEYRNKTKQILFAPEGTSIDTVEFLKLIEYLCRSTIDMVFCLRLHPNLSANFRIRSYIKKLQAQNNFCLSINTLYEDLNTSDAVFYRSSAVGIEALRFKTYPIFYGDASQKGLDVLEGLSSHASFIDSPIKALNFLEKKIPTISKAKREKFFTQIFSKLDYSKLT